MRISIAGDHAGFELKEHIKQFLSAEGHEVQDLGAFDTAPSDYPDFAEALAKVILEGGADKGILLCGSGVGASVAANKIPGIRAALAHDTYSAERAAKSNNAQIITMGARVIGPEVAKTIVDVWLASKFDPEGSSAGNVKAIDKLDSAKLA